MARRRRRSNPSFEAIKEDVWGSIVAATNDYGFLTDLVLPIVKQRRLHGDYPFITSTLVRTASEHILLAVCRLFDPDPDPRMASLTTFLGGVVEHHSVVPDDVTPRTRERRAEFERRFPNGSRPSNGDGRCCRCTATRTWPIAT